MGWIGSVFGLEFGRALRSVKQAGRLFYEHLGLSALVSAYWYVLAFLPVTYLILVANVGIDRLLESMAGTPDADALFRVTVVSYLPALLVAVVWSGPITAVAFSAVMTLLERDVLYARDLVTRLPRYYKKTVGSLAIAVVLLVFMVVAFRFYLVSNVTILKWLSVLFGYFIAFWFLGLQYLFPFIVQQTVGVRKTLQRAALVALDNVVVSLLLALVGGGLFWLSYRTMIPLVLVFMGFAAAMYNFGLIEILKKYDDPPPGNA